MANIKWTVPSFVLLEGKDDAGNTLQIRWYAVDKDFTLETQTMGTVVGVYVPIKNNERYAACPTFTDALEVLESLANS